MDLLIVGVEPRSGGSRLPLGVRVVPLPRPKGQNFRRKLSLMIRLGEYVPVIFKHLRTADVVYIPVPGDIPLVAMIIGLLLRKRLIVRYGGSWENTSQTTVMERITRLLMKTFAGGNNVMLVAGAGENPPAPRMSWIFSTSLTQAELKRIRPDVNRKDGRPALLVYAGRLSPEKGLDLLIRVMAGFDREFIEDPPILTIAGDGPEREKLEALAMQLGCANRISFSGQLTRAELSALFMRSDICVQPSLTEGYSKTWLDAMAHGLPVLASQVGAAKEVVGSSGERGWLIPPGDIDALTGVLKRVLSSETDWIQLRHRCRKFVEGRTIEEWGKAIGTACASQWGLILETSGCVSASPPNRASAYADT